MDKTTTINIIKDYIQLLEKEGVTIDKAFLYGSYAKDAQNTESDIDVMLVSALFEQQNDQLWGKVWMLTKRINSRLEPYLVSTNRFLQDNFSPIIQIVKKEGISIL